MICDPLTKKFNNSNARTLLRLAQSGRTKLGSELDETAFREEVKKSEQTLQRLKGKALDPVGDGAVPVETTSGHGTTIRGAGNCGRLRAGRGADLATA